MTILVIACGSPIRSDDRIGPLAAEVLTSRLADLPVEVLSVHQFTPELSEPISRASLAVFIDAAAQGTPGMLLVQPVTAQAPTSAFTHQMSPAALLHMAEMLYGAAPPALMFTLAGENFEIGETLSNTVAQALPALTDAVTQVIFDAVAQV